MTPKERAAMQQALDKSLRVEQDSEEMLGDDGMVMVVPLDAYNDMMESIAALREALEQPVSQEPVAWGVRSTDSLLIFQNEAQAYHYATPWEFVVIPLYTAPPKRKWVEPTVFHVDNACAGTQTFGEVARAVLKLSKELNHG